MKYCEDHISAYQVMVVIHKIHNMNEYDFFKEKGYDQSIQSCFVMKMQTIKIFPRNCQSNIG